MNVGAPPVPMFRSDPTMLYIDDNPGNTQLMKHIMTLRPAITFLTADRGISGLALAQQCRPDLVLLDFHLPDINGDEVLARLLADPRTAGIPVVVVSGDATPARVQRLLDLGARRYVTKPFRVQALLALVDGLTTSRLPQL